MSNINIIFLCVGCIIGWGAFVLPQDLFLSKIGLFESIIGLFLGGVSICLIAANYTFLLKRLRRGGGEFYFTLKTLGRTHGFICGWFLSLAYLCIIPLNATALSVMSHSFGLNSNVILYHINNTPIYLTDIVISALSIVCVGMINILGIKAVFILQKLLVIILCGSVMLFFIIMGLDAHSYENLSSYFTWDLNIYSIMIVFTLTPWAYLGFDCAIQMIESLHHNMRIFNAFMYISIWIGFLLYCMLICITAFGITQHNILLYSWATYKSISDFFGIFGSVILCMGVFGAILSGINGFFITTTKLLESLSIHYFLPHTLINLNRFGVPYRIIYAVGFLSCVMVIFGRESLLYIVDMACVGIIVGFLYVSIIAFLLKKNHLNYFSFSSFFSIVLSILFLLLEFLPFSPAALKTPSLIALAVWSILGGIILCFLKQKI